MQGIRTTAYTAGIAALVAMVALVAALFATQPAYAAADADLAGADVPVSATSKDPAVVIHSDLAKVRIGETRNVRAKNEVEGQTGQWKWEVAKGENCVTIANADKMSAQITGKANGDVTLTCTYTNDNGKSNTAQCNIIVTGIKDTITVNGYTYKRTGIKTVTLTGMTKNVTKTRERIANQINVGDKGSKYAALYGVTEIGKSALTKLPKCTYLTLGTNVMKVGASAFNGDSVLKIIELSTTKLKTTTNCLAGKNAVKTVKAPSAKYTAYKKLFTKSVCGKAGVNVVKI